MRSGHLTYNKYKNKINYNEIKISLTFLCYHVIFAFTIIIINFYFFLNKSNNDLYVS